MINPFINRKPNPKRDRPRRVGNDRVKLYGKAKSERRREIYNRAKGRCENIIDGERCNKYASWEEGEWSHNHHASRKDDSMYGGIWSCSTCHSSKHNGGKPVKRRPGRKMKKSEALAYLKGEICFCNKPKKAHTIFCLECFDLVSPQTKMNLAELHNDEWLQAASDAEHEIMLRWLEGKEKAI